MSKVAPAKVRRKGVKITHEQLDALCEHNEANEYRMIEESVADTDLDKCYERMDMICIDVHTQKYYRLSYVRSNYLNLKQANSFPITAEEVSPKEKMIIVYE